MTSSGLPYIDTHAVGVDAAAEDLWQAVMVATARFSGDGNPWVARVLGTQPPSGFAVVVENPGRAVLLTGRHRFSVYELRFLVEPRTPEQGALLSAVTHADFPGLRGTLYRTVVIRTGLHGIVTRLVLASMARACTTGSSGK